MHPYNEKGKKIKGFNWGIHWGLFDKHTLTLDHDTIVGTVDQDIWERRAK